MYKKLLFVLVSIVILTLPVRAENYSVKLPTLMYHSICPNPLKPNDYNISPAEFEQDMAYLQKCGYTAIFPRDLTTGAALPPNPVVLTFDDGHYNNVYYAEPVLKKYGMKAAIYIVGEYADRATRERDENPVYSYLTWERIGELDGGIWEAGGHSYNMHELSARKGMTRIPAESDKDYTFTLRKDLENITLAIETATGVRPVSFAYPFGYYNSETDKTLKKLGYKVAMTCETGATLQNGDLMKMRRLGRFPGITAEKLLKNI